MKCDACGLDLTFTSDTVGYRIALTNENRFGPEQTPPSGVGPVIDRPHRFCDISCLKMWLGFDGGWSGERF